MLLAEDEDLHLDDVLGLSTIPRLSRHSGLVCRWHGEVPASPRKRRYYGFQMALKRCIDIAMAGAGLLLLSPAFLIIILAIRLETPGPIFFCQQRLGHNGLPFRILKFRTIHRRYCDRSGCRQAVPGDVRLTRVGKWLRRYSLDELPQLLNILRGEMSLVGPRPHVPGMLAGGQSYEALVPYYPMRHAMRPGLTGWAQANSLRGPTFDADVARARIDHDIAYLQNFSLWLDARIIWRTLIREILPGRGC